MGIPFLTVTDPLAFSGLWTVRIYSANHTSYFDISDIYIYSVDIERCLAVIYLEWSNSIVSQFL